MSGRGVLMSSAAGDTWKAINQAAWKEEVCAACTPAATLLAWQQALGSHRLDVLMFKAEGYEDAETD
jgi:hypothetical protein